MSAADATADAVARLRAAALTVYDGKVPVDPTTGRLPDRPYVVVYGPGNGAGASMLDSLAGTSHRTDGIVQTTVVGDNAESVRIVGRKVRAALLDVIPDITGRSSFPIRHDDAQPVRRDDDVQPPVLYGVDRWLYQSTPA